MFIVIEGSLEAKFPTILIDGKAQQPARSTEMEKIRDGESQKRKDASVRKGRKVAKHCVLQFFQCFVAPEGRKVGSLKRRVRS